MALFKKVSTEEKREFVRLLLTLLRTGKPINECFDSLAKQEARHSPYLKEIAERAKQRTEKGTPIYEVFKADPNFEPAFSSYIRAGEEGGSLEVSLNYLVDWLDRKATLESDISSATLYPKIVLVFAILLGGGLTYFVFPRLIPVFKALNVELPLTSKMLFFMSLFVQDYGLYVLVGLIGLVAALYFIRKIQTVQIILDKIVLKIPFVSDIAKHYQLTLMSQLTATLFESGLTITKILDVLIESLPSYSYKESLREAKKRITMGDSFSEALNNFPQLYPYLYVSMLATGEQSGTYGEVFSRLADFYSQELTSKTKKIGVVLEPLILIVLGLFVAFVASAIILPVYRMTGGLYPK